MSHEAQNFILAVMLLLLTGGMAYIGYLGVQLVALGKVVAGLFVAVEHLVKALDRIQANQK